MQARLFPPRAVELGGGLEHLPWTDSLHRQRQLRWPTTTAEDADVRRTARWWAAALVTIVVFLATTWVAGVFLLPLVMKSDADRWVVAAGLGVAVAAFAALWGHSWAGGESQSQAEPGTATAGMRSITSAGDISGIASSGDNTTNTQQK